MPDREIAAEMLDGSITALKKLTTKYYRIDLTADQVALILRRIREEARIASAMIDEILGKEV